MHHLASRSYEWVVEADIEACFDRIDHAALKDRVRERVADKRVLGLIKAFLHAGILTEQGRFDRTVTGTPQGGILSPLLANIALSALDEHFLGRGRRWEPTAASASSDGARAWRPIDSSAPPTTSSSSCRASAATPKR